MKSTNLILIGVIALLVGGGLGFVGGMQYQKSKTPATSNFAGNGNFAGRGNGQNRGQFNRNGMNAVRGSIVSVDNGSLTVQLPDGSSKIVILGSSARIEQTQSANTSDLKTGEQVLVFGTTNSDGSVTAQNVQINPMFGSPGAGRNPSASPTAKPY